MAKILVVDDEAPIRALMRATLSMAGHLVAEAAGGEEALEKIKNTEFDVVLLDIMMPVTDGYEVLDRLKAMPSRATLPVIVVTAKTYESKNIMREVTAGAIDHITKPFEPEELEAAVDRALSTTRHQLEVKRGMMSRGAALYGAVEQMRELAKAASEAEEEEEQDQEALVAERPRPAFRRRDDG